MMIDTINTRSRALYQTKMQDFVDDDMSDDDDDDDFSLFFLLLCVQRWPIACLPFVIVVVCLNLQCVGGSSSEQPSSKQATSQDERDFFPQFKVVCVCTSIYADCLLLLVTATGSLGWSVVIIKQRIGLQVCACPHLHHHQHQHLPQLPLVNQ